MAEGAHLTSAVSTDKPSIFEVLAQESLMTTIRPALKHAVRVLAEGRPEKWSWLLRYYEEIYTTLDCLLQSYCLKKYNASFAENFYDLCRVPVGRGSQGLLPAGVYWKSLICLVILPYIKEKLDQKFEDARHFYNTYAGNKNNLPVLLRAFLGVYPYVHTVWEGAVLWYQVSYMFGKTDWHSPFLKLSGTVLAHNMDMDLGNAETLESFVWKDASFTQRLKYLSGHTFNMAAVAVSTSLSVGVFFLQFLDWWYTSEGQATSLTALPVPDPPKKNTNSVESGYNVCPICHRTRSNDTALSVSGFVFCYPCIYDYIKQYGCCPVTKYPARTEHLIKIYLTDT